MLNKKSNLLTVKEVAQWFAVHPMTIYRKISSGKLPAIKFGKSWLLPKEILQDWIDSQIDSAVSKIAKDVQTTSSGRAESTVDTNSENSLTNGLNLQSTDLEASSVQKRLQDISLFIKELKDLGDIAKADFLKSRERQYAVMHLLQLTIEAAVGLGNLLVTREQLGNPENYRQIFLLLEKSGVLPADFAQEMKKMASLHNQLIHRYWETDLSQIYLIITSKLDLFKIFILFLQKAYSI